MGRNNTCKVYERLAGAAPAADGIRPGGLELTQRALAWCGFSRRSRILDVGCGPGVTLDLLTRTLGSVAIGIDASSALLERGRTGNPDLLLVRASGESLPFADECADGVISECSLSVIDDPGRALDEIRRVLKVGGRMILSDVYARNPDGIGPLLNMPIDCCLRGAVSRQELVEKLITRSFAIEVWEDHSDRLEKFAVQLIFHYGSMNRFWIAAGSQSVDPEEIQRAISQAKPGYFLLIAQKRAVGQKRHEVTDDDG